MVDKIYMTLHQIFARATAQSVIDRGPTLTLEKPNAHEGKRRALTEAETAAALAVCAAHPEGLLLVIFYYTGARISEVLGLQWRDIDFSANSITFERDVDFRIGGEGSLKTSSSYRTIPLAPELKAALWPSRGIGVTPVLPAPQSGGYLSQNTYKRRWERLASAMLAFDPTLEHRDKPLVKARAKKAESNRIIPQDSILTPHYFRHNFATILYNADVDVLSAQRWLGHSDPGTTLEIYSHLSKDKEERNADKLFNAFSKKVAEKLPGTQK